MNLTKLKERVDRSIDSLNKQGIDPESVTVCITTNETSIGARAFTTIDSANLGFDWEHKQFRVEPKVDLVKQK